MTADDSRLAFGRMHPDETGRSGSARTVPVWCASDSVCDELRWCECSGGCSQCLVRYEHGPREPGDVTSIINCRNEADCGPEYSKYKSIKQNIEKWTCIKKKLTMPNGRLSLSVSLLERLRTVCTVSSVCSFKHRGGPYQKNISIGSIGSIGSLGSRSTIFTGLPFYIFACGLNYEIDQRS